MNEWFCTDPDCFQYCKQVGKREFQFIKMVWLDMCRGDKGYPDKNYTVKSAYVDLDDYSKKDIECHICGYYSNLDDLYLEYGEDSDQIIAECIFEEMCSGLAITYGMMTEDEAKMFIKNYIQ